MQEDKRECFGKYVNSSSVCYKCSDEARCIEETLDIKDIRKKIEETGDSNRLSKDDYYLNIALAVSKRSTCLKRHYGCVIVNNDEIIATGYNGSPRNEKNCCALGICKNKHERNDGNYSLCEAVHAEQNAMISTSRKDMIGATLYLACENYEMIDAGNNIGKWIEDTSDEVKPCKICERMIKNTGISKVLSKGYTKIFL